jgi:Ulp1 family protease
MLTRLQARKEICEMNAQTDENDPRFILKVKLKGIEEDEESTKYDHFTFKIYPNESGSMSTSLSEKYNDFILRVPLADSPHYLKELANLSINKACNSSSTSSCEEMEVDDEYNVFCKYILKNPYGRENELNITYKDYNSLDGTNYVNSSIIFFFLKMLQDQYIPINKKKFNIHDTYFFTKLSFEEIGEFDKPLLTYKSIRKWGGMNLFDYDFFLFPIFKDKHWSLILIYDLQNIGNIFKEEESCFKSQYPTIIYFDSLYTDDDNIVDIFKKYLIYEYARKNNLFKDDENALVEFISNRHSLINFYIPAVPMQNNHHDCGIYLLTYAELILKDFDVIVQKVRDDKLDKWFDDSLIKDKRKVVRKLIRKIKKYGQDEAMKKYFT